MSFTDTRKCGCTLWLKVVTSTPVTCREYYNMITSHSQTYKRFVSNRSAVVFSIIAMLLTLCRIEEHLKKMKSYCKHGTRQSYSIRSVKYWQQNLENMEAECEPKSIKGNRQGLNSQRVILRLSDRTSDPVRKHFFKTTEWHSRSSGRPWYDMFCSMIRNILTKRIKTFHRAALSLPNSTHEKVDNRKDT